MYYRVGASNPTKQFGLVPTDEGELLCTDTAIYFGGNRSTLRIPHKNILRLESFTDGVACSRAMEAARYSSLAIEVWKWIGSSITCCLPSAIKY